MIERDNKEKVNNCMLKLSLSRNTKNQEDVLEEFETVIKEEKDINKFISDRLEKLNMSSKEIRISHIESNFYNGYINPNTNILISYMVDPFKLDDKEIYSVFINSLKEILNSPGWENKPIKTVIIKGIPYVIGKYFGNIYSNSRIEQANKEFYLDKCSCDSEAFSISELRDKGIAVCVEKASFT